MTLHLAVRTDQIDIVEKIMMKDSDMGLSAFHHACALGRVKIAEIFIDNYLDLNIELNSKTNTEAKTSFDLACMFGQTKIAEILVKNCQNI